MAIKSALNALLLQWPCLHSDMTEHVFNVRANTLQAHLKLLVKIFKQPSSMWYMQCMCGVLIQ